LTTISPPFFLKKNFNFYLLLIILSFIPNFGKKKGGSLSKQPFLEKP